MTPSEEFEKAVRDLLKPIEGTFAYEAMVQNHLDTEKYRPWVEVIDTFKSVRGSAVLSSGCGSANDMVAFLDKGAARVCGVEVDGDLVRVANQRFARDARRDRVEIVLYDGRKLPYGSGEFDIVFSIHVMEHVPRIGDYLEELFRVLKPGGIVFVDIPNRFFRREQHTGLAKVHLLPHRLRDAFIAAALSPGLRGRLSEHTRQKLNALRGMRPPYPWQVTRACRKVGGRHGVLIEEAVFHDYGARRIPFSKAHRSPLEIFRHLSTCRLVLRKRVDGRP
jgi:SAM-dependent methyltransferase